MFQIELVTYRQTYNEKKKSFTITGPVGKAPFEVGLWCWDTVVGVERGSPGRDLGPEWVTESRLLYCQFNSSSLSEPSKGQSRPESRNQIIKVELQKPRWMSRAFESHPQLGSAGWEVILQWRWPLGPCAQGGLPHSQGTSRQPPHGCSLTFALRERAREPRPVCTVLGSCGQNTLGAHLETGLGGPNWHFSPGEP